MDEHPRKIDLVDARRQVENERLRRAFEELEDQIAWFEHPQASRVDQAMQEGFRAAFWSLRQALDGPDG